jgi:hypothetical protein
MRDLGLPPVARLPALSALTVGLALTATGCALSSASPSARQRDRAAQIAALEPMDRLTREVKLRYGQEAWGSATHLELRRVLTDPGLRSALRGGSRTMLVDYVSRQFRDVWYHQHLSRLRLSQRGHVVVDVGVPFVVRAALGVLPASGRSPATQVQVSVQDVIGYVRYVRRNLHADTVVRGVGAAHVRTSLPAARHVALPTRGKVTLSGRRYEVRSFHEIGFKREPLTIWVLKVL